MRRRLSLTVLQLRAKLMTSFENNNNKVQLTAYAVSVKVRVVDRCRCQCAYAPLHAVTRRVLGTRLKKTKKTWCICERQKPQDQRRPSPKTSGTTIAHATPTLPHATPTLLPHATDPVTRWAFVVAWHRKPFKCNDSDPPVRARTRAALAITG